MPLPLPRIRGGNPGTPPVLADDSGLIFPSTTGRGPLGANTLTKLSHELRLGCTPHGMRSSFQTWCSETEQPRELAEQPLAHVNPNRVEAAYMRSDLFERRRELMEAWSDYLLQPKALASRVEDWRADGRVRWQFQPLSRWSAVRLPWSRFQPPPRQTQHADFPHYAFLPASRQGLCGRSRRERFQSSP